MLFGALQVAASQLSDASLPAVVSTKSCRFHALCLCDHVHMKAYCRKVAFSTLPEVEEYSEVTIRECSSLRILKRATPAEFSRVASLRVNDNPLDQIEPQAFARVKNVTNLDLSRNQLTVVPVEAILELRRLQRLDLRFNSIGDLDEKDMTRMSQALPSLRSLHLSSNVITFVQDGTFSGFDKLTILDLDNNNILSLQGQPFPRSVVRLNLTGNLLEQVPQSALAELRDLSYLLLRDNLIERLDANGTLPRAHLDTLDLGRNVMSQLPPRLFQSQKVSVRNLLLSDNYHRYVPSGLFKSLAPRHLSLSVNHIKTLPEELFEGLNEVVTHLDLSHNELAEFPKAILKLQRLHTLNFRDNQLNKFSEHDLYACRTSLRVLDISDNGFESVPNIALKDLSRLKSLNMAYNHLKRIERHEMKNGLEELLSLDLSGNEIDHIEDRAFENLPKLEILRIAYNPIATVEFTWFPAGCMPLRTLDISGTRIPSDALDVFLQVCRKISSLDVAYAALRNTQPATLNSANDLIALYAIQNNWQSLPARFINSTACENLTTAIIARNRIDKIPSHAFSELPRLQTIDLSGNQVTELKASSFNRLINLANVDLSHNQISRIHAKAINDLPQLQTLDLSSNRLSDLNMNFLVNKNTDRTVQINLSNNQISSLLADSDVQNVIVNVTSLDLSKNIIRSIARHFFWTTRHSLTFLNLSYNFLDTLSIEVTSELPQVKVLDLSHNLIVKLSPRSFQASSEIHVLLLSHNRLSSLPDEAFARMTRLDVLKLDDNQITTLPDDAFEETALVHVSISRNSLARPFTKAFSPVKDTLVHLDLSFNKIRLIATSEFDHLYSLEYLDLSSNNIVSLPSQVFANMSRLVSLDVSRNPLLRVQFESFRLPVSSLSLNDCNLTCVPVIDAPNLKELSLSSNAIANLPASSFAGLPKLRTLNLACNGISHVYAGLWQHITELRSLNLSGNPITELGSESFKPLQALHHLDVTGLQLALFDARILDDLKCLRSVRTNTYSSARASWLQETLFHAKALQKLTVLVDESVLSYQIQHVFSEKMTELSVTGSELRSVAADAFEGLHAHGPLTIRVRGCPQLDALPAGLMRHWADLPRLSLDLSDNARMTGFAAEDDEEPNDSVPVETIRLSHYVTSSFQMQGTPLSCDCRLLWFQRRLLRQRRHLSGVLNTNQDRRSEPHCIVPGTNNKMIPMSMLRPGTPHCVGDATGSGSCVASRFRALHYVVLILTLRSVG